MKYFDLALDSGIYKTAPRLVNWYGVQDVRLIKWETYHKLQNRQIYVYRYCIHPLSAGFPNGKGYHKDVWGQGGF